MLAATETLVVTYTGADEYSGQPRPPAVPLGELLDALDRHRHRSGAGSRGGRDRPAPAAALRPAQRDAGRAGAAAARSPSTAPRSPARRAAAGPRTAPPPFLDRSAAAVARGRRLASTTSPPGSSTRSATSSATGSTSPCPQDEEPVDDGLPVEIDSLAQWAVGDRLLRDLLAGVDPDRARQQEWRRGVLPPGRLGWRMLQQILDRAPPPGRAGARPAHRRGPRRCDVDVDLGGGRRLRGTVPEVYGDRLVPVSYSRLGPTHRLQSWMQLLALTASDPDRQLDRPHHRPADQQPVPGQPLALAARAARRLHRPRPAPRTWSPARRGLCEPLPLPLKTSFAYARQRRTRATHDEALVKAGRTGTTAGSPASTSEAAQVRAWGPRPRSRVSTGRPRPARSATARPPASAPSPLRLWSPLLVAEQGSW